MYSLHKVHYIDLFQDLDQLQDLLHNKVLDQVDKIKFLDQDQDQVKLSDQALDCFLEFVLCIIFIIYSKSTI